MTSKPTDVTIRSAKFLASATDLGTLPAPAFAEIAFAGRSNVGKSSLINALVQRKKLVRTSSTPGCTRGVNLFRVELADPEGVVDFVDLPGYGYAKRSKVERASWGPLIEGFLTTRPGLRATVVIVDVRRGIEEDDRALLSFLQSAEVRPIVAATKLDKLPASKRKPALSKLRNAAGTHVHGFSALDKTGREELWASLLRAAHVG